eukprot:scaffold22741_cov111-Isochrysis_galbana.AAC.3
MEPPLSVKSPMLAWRPADARRRAKDTRDKTSPAASTMIPGASGVPSIEYVLPLDVCPKASNVQLSPSRSDEIIGATAV